ncbi:J domain-containing protein [Planctomycetota bacterium]
MQNVSLYDVLGVDADATPEQIRLAFLSLAHRFHPDLNSDDAHEERFKQLRHAYEILSCPDRREVYDRTCDSYATMIRQTATPVPENVRRRSNHRASDSPNGFRTKWLKDKKLGRERWFFVASAMLSVGIVYWAIRYIPEMRRQITEQSHVVAEDVPATESAELPLVPTNPLPNASRDLKKYFDENDAAADKREKDATADGRANKPSFDLTKNKRSDTSEWAFTAGDGKQPTIDFPLVANRLYGGIGAKSVPTWGRFENPTPVAVIPRIDIQRGYWRDAPPAARVPLQIGRAPVPSQAELTSSYHSFSMSQMRMPSTGYAQNSFSEIQPPINTLPPGPSSPGPPLHGYGGTPRTSHPSYLPLRSHSLPLHPSLTNPVPQIYGSGY